MMHVDIYKLMPYQPVELLESETEPSLSALGWGLPYWNGYVLTTDFHGSGECEAHRPTGDWVSLQVPDDPLVIPHA